MINRCFVMLLIGAGVCSWAAQAQTSSPFISEGKQAYRGVKNNILRSAEKMPAENFSFKPTPEVRSFAEVLGHIAQAQIRTCSTVLGGGMAAAHIGPNSPKADVMAAVNGAFGECDKAWDSLTDATATQMVSSFRGQVTKLGALNRNSIHDAEQYGIMTVYMRLKGVVPPASEPHTMK